MTGSYRISPHIGQAMNFCRVLRSSSNYLYVSHGTRNVRRTGRYLPLKLSLHMFSFLQPGFGDACVGALLGLLGAGLGLLGAGLGLFRYEHKVRNSPSQVLEARREWIAMMVLTRVQSEKGKRGLVCTHLVMILHWGLLIWDDVAVGVVHGRDILGGYIGRHSGVSGPPCVVRGHSTRLTFCSLQASSVPT